MPDCLCRNGGLYFLQPRRKIGYLRAEQWRVTQWGKECVPEKSLKFSQHLIFHQVKGEQKFLFAYQKTEEAAANSLITRKNEIIQCLPISFERIRIESN